MNSDGARLVGACMDIELLLWIFLKTCTHQCSRIDAKQAQVDAVPAHIDTSLATST